jgi:hypothetical protein
MSATVVLVTLLLAPATSGGATASSACEAWTRASTAVPALVREWFAHSTDERVLACQQPATTGTDGAPLYFGEGSVTQRGAVCSYLSHGLTLAGSGAAARLQRYDRTEALTMALADMDCPRPHTGAGPRVYVETYDVSREAFVAIMRLWLATSAPPSAAAGSTDASRPAAAGSGPGGATAGDETRAKMQATIGPSRMSGAAVTRIVRIPGSLLHHRYALFINAPDPPAGSASLYVIYVDKHVRGPYQITAFAETN